MSSNKPLVDIVIPVYGLPDVVKTCVEAVRRSNVPFNLIMVDDKSPDHDVMRETYKSIGVRPVWNNDNLGFAGTVNRGVSRGTAPLILILNTDVLLEPDCVDNMVKEMDDPSVGVVGALLTFPHGSGWGNGGKVQHAGMAFDITGRPFHIFLGWDPTHPRVAVRREMNCVTGACFMTRRTVWNALGGLPSVYGKGTFEDVEYCVRVRQSSRKIVFTPAARGVHYVGSSVVEAKQSFPLRQNETLFRSRLGPSLIWDEYLYW